MAETCTTCHLVHADGVPEFPADPMEILAARRGNCIDAQKTAMRYLLQKIGKQGACRACGADIFWVRHANGKVTPYTPAGLNHFVDCPGRAQFATKKSGEKGYTGI